jgi:CO/xanthine dehydrogenase Mo-binding subunit
MAPPDTDLVPDSGPTVASRTCMVVGRVVQQAARALADAMAHALEEKENKNGGLGGAAPQKSASQQSPPQKKITYDPAQAAFVRDPQTVATWDEAVAQLRATDAWPLRTSRVYEPPPDLQWDELAYRGDAYPVFSWAADVAHVELDVDTYEIKVLEFFTAEDVGKAIHPRLVEGQIEGGTLQGIGYGMMEELVMKDGAVLNPRMTNYIIPTSLDAPEIRTYLVEVPFSGGPHGAKGVGELPLDGAAPAVAAAIEMAAGVRVTEAPFTPEKLFRAWAR